MKYKTAFYPDIDGKPVPVTLQEQELALLLSGQPLPLNSSNHPSGSLLHMDGPESACGLPCMRISPAKDCARHHLRQAMNTLPAALSFVRYRVCCDFYVFRQQTFPSDIVSYATHLCPERCIPLEETMLAIHDGSACIAYNSAHRQYQLCLEGSDLAAVLDARLAAMQEITARCARSGHRAFWIPKLDGLAPSGLSIGLIGTEALCEDTAKAALRGLYAHAKSMTLAFCTQVNSYKRITPRHITPGQRIPCYLRCAVTDDCNALVRWSVSEHTLTYFLADNYCNPYLAAAAVLYMLSDGVSRYAGCDNDPAFQQFLHSRERMPNSLSIACGLWKKDIFSRQVLGETLWCTLCDSAVKEWEEYCDVAHPWELMRGVEFEQ